jgi:hypothetical protein
LIELFDLINKEAIRDWKDLFSYFYNLCIIEVWEHVINAKNRRL